MALREAVAEKLCGSPVNRRVSRPQNFACSAARILQMFENVERKNPVKNFVTKRKAMRVADDVSVAEYLMLEFDAIRVSRRSRARADV